MSDFITFGWLLFALAGLIFTAANLREAKERQRVAASVKNNRYAVRMLIVDGPVHRTRIRLYVFWWWVALGVAFGFFGDLLPEVLGLAGVMGLVVTAGGLAYAGLHELRDNKRLDEMLRKELLESAMAPEAVISIDEASIILFANETAHQLFGYEPGTLLGRSLTEIQPTRYRAAHRDAVRRYMVGGKQTLDWNGIEGHGLRRDGSEFPVLIILNEDMVEGRRVFTGVIRPVAE